MSITVYNEGEFSTYFCKISLILSLSTGRKEDEAEIKWMERERERAAKEREREERGKVTQMWTLSF